MKACFAVAIVIIALLISASIFGVLYSILNPKFDRNSTCLTEKCNKTTKLLKESDITLFTDCDNFYSYVCEQFSRSNVLKTSTELYMLQQEMLMDLLKGSENVTDDFGAVFIAREFYSVCQENNDSERSLKKIKNIFTACGGFPVLDGSKFDESSWSLLETTKKLRNFGLFTDFLFTVKVGYHPADLQNTTFHLKNPRLVIEQYEDCGKVDDCLVSYVLYFVDIVMKFGASRETALFDGFRIFSLEMKLFNLVWENQPKLKENEIEDQVLSLANLSTFDYLNWTEYFTILIGSDEYVTEDLMVLVENPGYLKMLKTIIEKTPKRVLANFMFWSALSRLKEYIPGYNRDYKDCFTLLERKMSYALQSMYVKKIEQSNTETIEIINKIAEMVKEEFLKMINNSDWISVHTKRDIFAKVKKIKVKVGYQEMLRNISFIDEHYTNISTSNSSLETMLALQKLNVDQYFGFCCKHVDDVFWDLNVKTFSHNVYYDASQNSIHILEDYLQKPLFIKQLSMFKNLGRLGVLIAQEMSHAVDPVGFRYDANGKLKSSLDETYFSAFKEKEKCFVEQYHNYMELGKEILKDNPRISGGFKKLEMIADSVGLALSFRAYRTYVKSFGGPFKERQDLVHTQDKIFFVNFAQIYCSKPSEKDKYDELLDFHAPDRYRFAGALYNLDEFKQVFRCKFNRMSNLKGNCTMW